jgi:hypothetical protein
MTFTSLGLWVMVYPSERQLKVCHGSRIKLRHVQNQVAYLFFSIHKGSEPSTPTKHKNYQEYGGLFQSASTLQWAQGGK